MRGFEYCPGAVERTLEIADRCNVEIEFGKYHFPTFTPPKEISLDDYLDELARNGLRASGSKGSPIQKSERPIGSGLDYELGVIKRMQFPGYFLVVADFINYAKQNGIPVGPGRGSSAGSLVAYAMRITDLDPIRHVLVVRAFSQSRTQVHARYRRRLLHPRPGAGDPICQRQIRRRPSGADRHLWNPQSQGGDQGCRARAWAFPLPKPTPSPS